MHVGVMENSHRDSFSRNSFLEVNPLLHSLEK